MSAVDKAFHGLRRMISSGRLGPGQRFPPESDLCAELGVSRSSLREAVRMLAALGAVQSRHGSGTFVSQLRPEDLLGRLALTVELLPLDGLLELFEIRRVLESHVMAQAAARITPEALDTLRGHLEVLEATDDPAEYTEFDHRFHADIARIGGSPSLQALLAVFRARSRHYQVFTMPEGATFKKAGDEDHRTILRALADRDPAAAATAAAAHIARSERWLDACRPPVTDAGPHAEAY
ncbi:MULTISPECIES: FadR/GntR family transcriptional regulator [Streptomyces]|uniref:FCD domain-containing protein n=1 Tax=Streptomyces salyersiae TaxID=3075530 RepID=A0ABU2RRW9_9ACTN|nr:FCD domain-containing protein [Streptomyces sp. DSM 41770]MDT0430654.1 FCD domain-containing protein [Streptomyces sp. DSM 41770]